MENDSNGGGEKVHPVIAWREALLADGTKHPTHALPSTARLVGLGLSMHARWSMKVWPSAAAVGKRCGLSERAVRTGFDALEAAGWASAVERGGVLGGRRTTVWHLTTPEGNAEVTPEGSAEVEADDPGTSVPTPEPPSTTPAADADELEEELGTELERAPATTLALCLVQREPEEAPLAVEAAMVRWGASRVTGLVRAYAIAGTQFLYASHLAARIDQDAPQRVVSVPSGPECPECRGTGTVLPLGTNTVAPCPRCSAAASGGDGHRSGGVAS